MSESLEFPKHFIEQVVPESVELNTSDENRPVNGIGGGVKNDANWYAVGTDLFDDQPDTVLATKTSDFTTIAQLGNGDFIAEINETIRFIDGSNAGDEIETKGLFKGAAVTFGGTITIPIVRGTGNFSNIAAVERYFNWN